MTDTGLHDARQQTGDQGFGTSPVIRFHIRNAGGIFLVLIGIVAIALVIMTLDFNKHEIRDRSVLERDFRDKVVALDALLSQVTSGLDAMRALAEADLAATLAAPGMDLPDEMGLIRQSKGYFHLDVLGEKDSITDAGNITGLGAYAGLDRSVLREIRMALSLNPLFAWFRRSVKTTAWIYYLSNQSFIHLYPWVPSSQWKLESQTYEKDFYLLSLPKMNPDRAVYWTPVYLDEAGKGLMSTCGIPVYDRDRYTGTLAIDLTVDFLNAAVSRFRQDRGVLLLINDQGQILAHPDIASSADAIIKTFSQALPDGFDLDLSDLGAFAPLKVRQHEDHLLVVARLHNAPWQAVYLEPVPPVLDRVMERIGPEPLALFVILFVLILGVLFANHVLFVRPSDRFVRYILRLDKGRFDKGPGPIPDMWRPWFSAIEKIFRENYDLTEQMRHYNEALEQRVAKRTRELVRLNRTLNREIVERERAQNAEMEMAHILDQAVAQSPAGIIIADARNLVIQRANRAAYSIRGNEEPDLGHTDLEAYFRSWKLFDSSGRPVQIEDMPLYQAVRDGRVTRNLELILKDANGRDRWLSVNAAPIRDAEGRIQSGIVIFNDISSLKEREMALYRNEQQVRRLKDLYKQLSDASFEAIFLSREGVCIGQNMRAETMFGYSLEQALGRKGIDWIAPESREKVGRHIASGFEGQYEALALRKDGSTFPCEIQARMSGSGDNLVRITALRDITERKQAEKERLEAQAFAAAQAKHALVGQVAGKMAHDFNNILGVIMGNAELALTDCEDPSLANTLELILGQTLRGKNMTRNLVAFARDQEPKQERFSINKKIRLVIQLLKKDLAGIELKLGLEEGLPDLIADPGMIEHMLVNLLLNAVHALGKTQDPTVLISTYGRNGHLGVVIRDNGCGIPEKYLDRIFEPSFTLKGSRDISGQYLPGIRGTGYGMANVKKYLDQHKGRIRVNSREGRGTNFTIELPVVDRELSVRDRQHVVRQGNVPGRRILLVEDEAAISNIQFNALTHPPCSHRVDVAEDGETAMTLFAANAYDLVSLDYVLTGDHNGIDVYQWIRKRNQDIPILFVSGNLEFIASLKAIKSRDDRVDHLSKPCLNKEYLQAVQALLAGPESAVS